MLPLLRGREWCARRAGDWPMLQHMPSAESRDGTNWCAYLRRKMDKAVPGRGFLLNNELTDFSFDEATGAGAGFANRPEGGKKRRASASVPPTPSRFSSLRPTYMLNPSAGYSVAYALNPTRKADAQSARVALPH